MLQKLTEEQTTSLANHLASPSPATPAAPRGADPVAPMAALGAASVMEPARTYGFKNPLVDAPREVRSRGVLTHEQEVLRAKVGWQASYYTTSEENAQERATGSGR